MPEDYVGMYTLLENQDTNKHNFAGGNMGLCFTFTGLVDDNTHTLKYVEWWLQYGLGGIEVGESESQGKENLAL